MTKNADDYEMITDSAALAAACDRLRKSPYVTVDTEFLRETTFWARLCLIQIASPDEAYIIDPLSASLELDSFFDLMADESVMKVFHAARQDVEIFVHLSGIVPKPLFDTQIAAMVCGFGDQVSYDQLVRRTTGGHVDKTSRFTDWSRRPLSQTQLHYALSDVTHLRDVYSTLLESLERQSRGHWVAEEMAILSDIETYRSHPENAWQRLKMRVKKPRQLAVMQSVAAWRETEAQKRDVPRNRVLKDDAIYEIAQQQPKNSDQLGQLRTIPRGYERSSAAQDILQAVEQAFAIGEADLPRIPRARTPPDHAGAATELLKVLLKMVAEQHGVASRIIANVEDLEKIAADDEADVRALKGWRRELFGEKALAIKNGELALALSGNRVAAVELQDIRQAAE
jgi:ribonuclease D